MLSRSSTDAPVTLVEPKARFGLIGVVAQLTKPCCTAHVNRLGNCPTIDNYSPVRSQSVEYVFSHFDTWSSASSLAMP